MLKKLNFIITIRYKILTFSSVGPLSEEGGGGLENFGQKLKLFRFFLIEVTPKRGGGVSKKSGKFSLFQF